MSILPAYKFSSPFMQVLNWAGSQGYEEPRFKVYDSSETVYLCIPYVTNAAGTEYCVAKEIYNSEGTKYNVE